MARPEAQAPVKPNLYSEEEIAALAAYVASLGPGPAIPEPAQYDPANLSEEEIARGGELFRTNCSACHNFEGAGGALPNGKYAPSLVGLDPKRIYRGDVDRPAADAGLLRRGAYDPRTSGPSSATSNDLHERPSRRRSWRSAASVPVSEGLWAWIIGLGSLMFFAIWIAAKGAKAK